jgi:hypothetical protein
MYRQFWRTGPFLVLRRRMAPQTREIDKPMANEPRANDSPLSDEERLKKALVAQVVSHLCQQQPVQA